MTAAAALAEERACYTYALAMVETQLKFHCIRLFDREETESIVACALALAWEKYDSNRGVNRATFLNACAWNAVLKEARATLSWRRIPNHEAISLEEILYGGQGYAELVIGTAPDPYEEFARTDETRWLLDSLPENQAAAVFLTVLDGWHGSQVAQARGVSKQAVNQQIHKGLARLRTLLEESE